MGLRSRVVVASFAAVGALVAGALPAAAITRNPADTPSSADGRVENSVQIGSDLYIGGLFTTVGGAPHTHLAALDAATGAVDPDFTVDVNGEVTSLATDGSTLFIAGSFTSVEGVARTNVAAINPATGAVLPFTADASAIVYSIDVAGGVVYLGGKFTTINGTTRKYLAAVNASTSVVTSFNPKPLAAVYVVKAATDGFIYAGGNFQTIGGATRNYVAQLTSTGAVTSWDAKLPFDSQVFDLTVDNGSVYLATGGHSPGGNSVYGVAAGDGTRQWQVQVDGNVQSVEFAGGMVYAGGHFNYLNPCAVSVCARKKALSIDPSTGNVSSWNPKFNSSLGVWDLTAAGGNLYALGDFTTVNGIPFVRIARFVL
jgi:PQQ-like domain